MGQVEEDILDILYEMIDKMPEDANARKEHVNSYAHILVDMITSANTVDRFKLVTGINIVKDYGHHFIDKSESLSKLNALKKL